MKKMKKLKYVFALAAVMAIGAGFLIKRTEVTDAVGEGLSVCGEILIPSLFPFMALSSFALNSGVFAKTERFAAPFMNKLFRLPGICFSAVFFGFIGGYPVGARMIAQMYETGNITKNRAKRMFSFCVNAGPAFIVTAAGGMMLGSQKAGYIMLVAVLLSSLIVGTVYSLFSFKDENINNPRHTENLKFSDALSSSVVSATDGILSVCGWVLAFSAVSGLVRPFIGSETAVCIFDALSEVTSGITEAVKIGGIPFAAAAISFGGICVMCQLLPSIKKCGIKISEYMLFRIVNAAVTYIITWIILRFVDISVSVSSPAPVLWSYSAPSSAALLMMCAVMILEAENKYNAVKKCKA